MITPDLVVFIITSILKSAIVVGVMLFMVAYSVVAERRVSAMIQDRIGPNRVGIPLTNIRLWGLGQPIADGLKFLLKEEFTPAGVNKFYFLLAPALAMIPALITVSVIPFGSFIDLRPLGTAIASALNWTGETAEQTIAALNIPAVIANLDVGLLFVFAIVSVSVYGIVLAGWASNSKFPFLGGIRASAQMISYELSMGLAVVPIFLAVGHLNLTEIVQHQINYGWFILPLGSADALGSWLLWLPMTISFLIFLIAAFAETNRLPFDLAECETELVGGYHTEYSAMKFALFFLGEYAAMIVVSAVMVTVFLGGWSLPLPWFNGQPIPETWPFLAGAEMPAWFGLIHIGVFLAKVAAFIFLFIVIRWTLPRFRYDQLMSLGWKFFIPLGFVNIFLTAIILALLHHS
ncbi:MAG: complex I subunit 1 family protein [Verrucomicrobiia bacterium]